MLINTQITSYLQVIGSEQDAVKETEKMKVIGKQQKRPMNDQSAYL